MIFLALTKSRIESPQDASQHTQLHTGGWWITAAAGGKRGSLTITKREILLDESAWHGAPEGYRFASIRVDLSDFSIRLSRAFAPGSELFYSLPSSGEFVCAMHPRLFERAGIPLAVNEAVLPHFFIYRHVSPPLTLYKDIRLLLPGSHITARYDRSRCHIGPEHQFDFPPASSRNGRTDEDFADEILSNLAITMRPLLLLHEETATLLSGGVDSSLLFQVARRELGINHTYSAGFPFEEAHLNLEKEYAISAAHALGSQHLFFEPTTAEYLHGYLSTIEATGFPLIHMQSVLLFLLFSHEMPPERRMVFCGLGADMIFGTGIWGEFIRAHPALMNVLCRIPGLDALQPVSRLFGRGSNLLADWKYGRALRKTPPLSDPDHVLWTLNAQGNRQWVKDLYQARDEEIIGSRYTLLVPYEGRPLNELIAILDMQSDAATPLVWGKAAENAGRVLLCPFEDPSFMSHTFALPSDLKVKPDKYLLRYAARRAGVPEFIMTRPKSSFGLLRNDWNRRNGIFDPLVPLAFPVFGEAELRHVQQQTSRDMKQIFWRMLNFAIWKRLCIDGEPLSKLVGELEQNLEAIHGTPESFRFIDHVGGRHEARG